MNSLATLILVSGLALSEHPPRLETSTLIWEGPAAGSYRAVIQPLELDASSDQVRYFVDCDGSLAVIDESISLKEGNVVGHSTFTDVASGFEIELREVIDYSARIDSLLELDVPWLLAQTPSAKVDGVVTTEVAVAEFSGNGTKPHEVTKAKVTAIARSLHGGDQPPSDVRPVPASFVETARCVQKLCEAIPAGDLSRPCVFIEQLPLDQFPRPQPAPSGTAPPRRLPHPRTLAGSAAEDEAFAILKAFPESYR